MLCPGCGNDNRPELKFCTGCGAGLGRSCPSCGEPSQPGERFCGHCGGPLTEPPEQTAAPPTSTSTAGHPTSFADGRYQVKELLGEGGKKLVYLAHDGTLDREVAFALIKTEGLDETSRTRITHEAQAMGRLGAHPHIVTVFDLGEHDGQPYIVTELMGGGDVEQAMGGEVTPQADLYSLGAMLYEMVTGRPPFVGDDSVAIIGQHLNTPPVAPTWHNPDVPPGLEALILRLLEKVPADRPASAASVAESLESIDLGAPIGTAERPSGPDPAYRKAFVGREAEVRQLHTAFDEAMSGHGSLVMVVGEPGIGKTTLCEQLATYATLRGGSQLVGHCYEEGSLSLPYLAFVEAMRSYVLAREPDDLKDDLGSGASEVARIVSEVRDRLQVEPSEPGDPEQDRYRLMQAVASFLTNAANVQPLVIVLEDLHDADRGTLDMLTHVSRSLSGARLMIVGTYRDVEVDRSHPLSSALAELRRVATFDRIRLRGLGADEVQRMMSSISGEDVPWSLSETVFRQTEGNPLFVQEVLRYLVEEGHFARGDGRSRRETPPEMSLPEGIKDVIGKRLSGLSDQCQGVLSVAAVIGREFHLQVLQKVAGLTEDELYAALEEASGVGVVEERSSVGGEVSFRFAHAFFRTTLYEETFTPRRIRLHQQVGQALEEVYGARLEEHAAEMAEHFSQSTERDDLQKALSYGETAAERAMSVFAYGEAVRLLEQALLVQEVLDPDDKARRCDLLLALGAAMMPAGDPLKVAEAVAPEAYKLAEELGDDRRALAVCIQAIWGLVRYGAGVMLERLEYRMWAERADRLAAPETTERVFADVWLSYVRAHDGELAERDALADRALKLARQLDDPEALWVAAPPNLIAAARTPAQLEETIRLAREVAEWPRAGVAAVSLAWTLHFCASKFLMKGERDRAEALWDEVEELGERTSDTQPVLLSLIRANLLSYMDGRLEESIQGAERFTDRAEELGSPVFIGLDAKYRPLLDLGRVEDALAATDHIFDRDSATRALCLAQLGRRAEARGAAARILAAAPRARVGRCPLAGI